MDAQPGGKSDSGSGEGRRYENKCRALKEHFDCFEKRLVAPAKRY